MQNLHKRNLPRSGTAWVTGAGTLVGATGGGTVPYILEASVLSAFPLPPETTVGMGFPTDDSLEVSSFPPAAVEFGMFTAGVCGTETGGVMGGGGPGGRNPGGKCSGLKPGRRNGGGGGGGTPGANPGGGIPKGAVKAGGWSAPTTGGPDGWGGTCGGGTVIGAGMGTGIGTGKALGIGDTGSLCAASAPPF